MLGGLAFASLGLELAIISFGALGLQRDWHLSAKELAWVTAVPGMGQLAGGILLGSLADRLGRRAMYSLSVGLLAGFTALASLSPNLVIVCVLLLLAGMGQGGAAPVVASMVAETAPTASRGRNMAVTELMWACGWMLAASAGRVLAQGASWRLLIAVGGAPLVLVPLAAVLLPPSGIAPTRASGTSEASNGAAILWSRGTRLHTALLWFLWIAMFGTFSGPVIWLPTLFAASGVADPAAKGLLVAVGILVGAVLAVLVIDRVGRRPLLVAAFSLAAACSLGFALGRGQLAMVAIGVLLGGAIQFIWPVMLSFSTECYPTRIRGMGMGWALGVGRVGAFGAPALLGILLASSGRFAAMLLFAVLMAGAAISALLFAPETSGRDLIAQAPLER